MRQGEHMRRFHTTKSATNPGRVTVDFVGPANVACCQQRTYSVTFRTSRYAKYFVFKSFRVNARRFVIDRSSVQVRSSAPVTSFVSSIARHRWWALFLLFFVLWGFCGDHSHHPPITLIDRIPDRTHFRVL